MIRKMGLVVWLLLELGVMVTAVAAQDTLRLSLSRDFGAGFGADIQGRFSMHVEGPEDLVRVLFFIDETQVAEQTTPPFRYQFNTGSYAPGVHVLRAAGVTADGRGLTSNTLTRNFLTSSDANQRVAMTIVPVIALGIGVSLFSWWLASRGQKASGQPAINGPFGGSICPKCHKPFARHWWGMNVVVGKLDRCPHCGKWSVVHRTHPDLLQAAYAAVLQAEKSAVDAPPPSAEDEEKTFRKQLDDSRFDN
ncbi:MAG: hypothetical protein HND44_21250 [Chloroflexi bacterium]|nr:hypothetical protein [Ardenticatenaceae bacterium]MBL1130969.1 hypothetical protein [Chloroflexota bacterium]NOG37068.1 hypothetical protein [Chloroflexota bacterium]GIK57046.1 MAG: hypothetical protein BroJett015_27090 [Chloroflexota bacterium]